MAKLAVREIRSHLTAYILTLREGTTTPEIVAGFRKKHGLSISNASRALEDMALTKIANDVSRKSTSEERGQLDLFAGYGVPRAICLPTTGKNNQKIHVPTAVAKIREAKLWVEYNSKPKAVTSTQLIEMRRMLDNILILEISDETSIEDALRLLKDEQERKTA